jgi:azurin/sugar phosphate isomerase/epimerase
MKHILLVALFLSSLPVAGLAAGDLFDKSNLVAWCIVPFDAGKRGPEERAVMLEKMGVKKFVYDYRREHIPQWDDELNALKKHNIELLGWWFPGALNEEAKNTLELFKRHGVRPQLWISGGDDTIAVKDEADQKARVEQQAARFKVICEAAAPLGCKVGIYNHGGWGGEPENAIAVTEALKAQGIQNIGIVYNLHHGHGHLDRLATVLPRMLPHLLCFNLNGMDIAGDTKGRKILPLGVGTEDVKVLRIVRASGYSGPIGILNHTDEDAEGRLLDNLDGLKWLVPQLDGAKPGEKPKYRTWEKANTKTPEPVVKAPKPAAFTPELPPLNKADNVHWQHFVNRERVFDFYGKQALQFMKQTPMPELLPAFPGLDGGQQGHWGNQNDKDTWKDGRWAAADLGTVFSTIFKGGGLTIPKGVCVRFDDRAACFDPLTCTFPVKWEGGFIQLSDERHGFTSGGALVGKVVGKAVPGKADKTLVYHGFYRHGKEVVFSYSRNGAEHLTTAREDGKDLSNLTKGGPVQWPQWIETRGVLGTQTPFATDTITIPFQNPYGTLFFISGHDFFSDGSAAICTMTGEVWLVRGIDEKLDKVRWKRFATGLHQSLGLKIVKDEIYVLGRDQITCLHDLNSDDEADFYECATHAMTTSPGGHDFITGLDCDREGRFYFASANQGICRVTLPDKLEVLGTGLRNPNGIGISPDEGFVTASQQEGDWIPASAICQIELGKNQSTHFGANGPKNGQPPEPPLLYLPRGEDNSSGGQCFVTSETWSSLKGDGNLIHLSTGSGSAWLMMRQQVNNQWQAAAMKISGNFDSGVQGGRFNAIDGHFYVSGMQGWGSYTPQDGCFQRVRFTGGSTPVPVGFEARDNGVLLRFNVPLDAGIAGRAAAHFAQCWNYLYSASYGSPEFSVLHSNTVGHDPLEIRSTQLLDGGKTLFIEIPQLLPANQIHLHISVTKDRAHDFFLTAHTLAGPFTAFTGYTKIAKTNHAVHVMPEVAAVRQVPWEKGEAGRELHIQATNGMQFAQKELRARAGERLTLTFDNPDAMPHNWVLVKPDAANRVGLLANQLVAAPDALARHYVPESPDILCHTRILEPHTKTTIHFTAPAQPGRYPYLCTFPGHWMVMRGILIVE